MKSVFTCLLIVFMTLLACTGCSSERFMTEDQAIQMVKDEFDDDKYFPIEITSVKQTDGYYEIIWTRDSNCEGGKVKINAVTGEWESEQYIC